MFRPPDEHRIRERVVVQPNGCWRWIGSVTSTGYPQLHVGDRRYVRAHRAAHEVFVGPIPDGAVVDHVCHNVDPECLGGRACLHILCVNPEHLQATTHRGNILAGKGLAAQNARKVVCKEGHPLQPHYRNPAWRCCPVCQKAKAARWEREHRAARNARRYERRTHVPAA